MKSSIQAGLATWEKADCIISALGTTDQTLWMDGAGGTTSSGSAIAAGGAETPAAGQPPKAWSIQGVKIVTTADGEVKVVAKSMAPNKTSVLETITMADINKQGTYFIPDGFKVSDPNRYLKIEITKNSTNAEVRVFGIAAV